MVTVADVAGSAAGVGQAILWVIIIGSIVGVMVFVLWWYSHKVVFVIRKVAGDRTLTKIDRARIIRKKGKPIRWRLRGMRQYVPVPPKEAIDVTVKGKLFVECYYTEDGEFHYIKDKLDGQIGSLYPVTNTDKEFYAQQVEEGKKYEQKNLGDIILQMAPYMVIVTILALFLIFFNEAVEPTISFGNQLSAASAQLSQAIETYNGCTQNIDVAAPN